MLGGSGGVRDGERDAWVYLGSQSGVAPCNQGIGAMEGAVYVGDNSWVGVAMKAQFDNNPVGIARRVNRG